MKRLATLLLAVFLPLSLSATLSPAAQAAIDSGLLSGLEARAIGPAAVGGRIAAVDVVASDPKHMVIGVATGGVWITDNGGLTWTPVFDDQPVASIGAVAINQSNPDIIWVGTGEGNTRNSTSIGGGLFKSVDGGKHWTLVGLENSERINRIALHPTDPDTVYVAALGTLWGPNEERGVYKTTDGGERWTRILYVDDTTGATDIKMDPSNPDKLIAAMWQFRRWPDRFESGGPGSGLFVSIDGGERWEERTQEDGLPAGDLGRMAVSFAASDPDIVYALVEAEKSALLRSDDGGASWNTVNDGHDIARRPFYYTEIYADPQNPDRVYNLYERVGVSIDGGRTFVPNPVVDCCTPGNTIHIDNHAFWINPLDPEHLVLGNDGGVAISRDRGATWRWVRNLPLAQFYHVRVDDEHPYNVYGGLQDNGSWRGPAEVWVTGGIRNLHWQEVGFGDGFDTIPDPENAEAGYAMSQGGNLTRYDLGKGESRFIKPAPPEPGVELRFNWDAAFAQDPFDPATIYYGSQFVHRSEDRGATWRVISDDLTSNDPNRQRYRDTGGLTPDVTAAENHTSLTVIAPSALDRNVIWVGSDDGRVHVTRDGGERWERIDQQRGVPEGAWVPMITPSPHEAGTAFVVFDDHRRSDMTPYLYRVEDHGRRWTRLGPEGLDGYALSILQDPVDPDLLFAGTEFGLYLSLDGGESWTKFTAGVPTVSVMDMAIQERESDLVLGTHGRSIYVIDDYSGLRGLESDAFNERLRILSATTGQHYLENPIASTRFTGSGEYRGPNEPYGVSVTFLANGQDLVHPDPEQERSRLIAQRKAGGKDTAGAADAEDSKPLKAVITVSDGDGEVLRRFTQEAHQGINRVTWNLRADGVRPAPGPGSAEPGADLPPGAEVPPGQYRLAIELDGETAAIDVETVADPRSEVSQEGREAQFAALMALQSLQETMVDALERIDAARQDLQTIDALMARQADNDRFEALQAQSKATGEALDALEKTFRTPPETTGIVYEAERVATRLSMAQWYVQSSPDAPSPTAQLYVEDARSALAEAVDSLNDFFAGDLARFRQAVQDEGIGLLTGAQPLQP